MKQIILKTVKFKLPNEAEARTLDYKEFLQGALTFPADGMLVADVRKVMRILDALDQAKSDIHKQPVLVLEDSDHAKLVEIFSRVKFTVVHQAVLDFADAINCTNGKDNGNHE